jgi:hypothetical protein
MNPHPHALAPLLLSLGRAGIELAPHPTDAARLRFKCPGGPADLPPDLSVRLRLHRGAILAMLVNGYTPDPPTDAGYVLGERLGVADGLGLHTHPGSPAWLVAVGKSMVKGCHPATHGVYSGHGSTNQGHIGGGEGERSNALRDRQGRGSGP